MSSTCVTCKCTVLQTFYHGLHITIWQSVQDMVRTFGQAHAYRQQVQLLDVYVQS